MRRENKIIIAGTGVFQRQELIAYENKILENKNVSEREASKFFYDFPKFLCIGGYHQIAREVVLYAGDRSIYRVDFFRKSFGDEYWDIVELKSPNKPFVVQRGKHWKFAADIEAGIHQAEDYSDLLDDEMNRFLLEEQSEIKAFRPKILIVGGRKSNEIEPIELRRLVSRSRSTEIKSYDDLYSFATENYKSGFIAIPVIQNSIIPSKVQTVFSLADNDMHISGMDLSLSRGIAGGVITDYLCPKCGETKTYCNWDFTSDINYWYDIYWHVCGKCKHIVRLNEKVERDYSIQEVLGDPSFCPICHRSFPQN